MKIGILQCDEMREIFLEQGFADYPDMIEAGFQDINAPFEFRVYRCLDGEIPGSTAECDGFITTGSRFSVLDEEPWMLELEAFLRKLVAEKVPFVGICFGHQMLAKALGGQVENADAGWGIGVSFNRLDLRHPDLPEQAGTELNLIVSHQDQVTRLPEQMKLLGGSDFCPNYFCAIGDHALTIQGHPEFSRDFSDALMEFRRNIIDEAIIDAGKRSLEARVDSRLTFEWMSNFFQS